jgi:DNA-binding transcriptional MocR family regulator
MDSPQNRRELGAQVKLIVTYEQLAQQLGISKASVCRYLKHLQDRGLIMRRSVNERGKHHLNEIVLAFVHHIPVIEPKRHKRTSNRGGNSPQIDAPYNKDKYTPFNPPPDETEWVDYFEDPALYTLCYRTLHDGSDPDVGALVCPVTLFRKSIVAQAKAQLGR